MASITTTRPLRTNEGPVELQKCLECGTPVDDTVLGGECPTCLFNMALSAEPASASVSEEMMYAPTVDQLNRKLDGFEIIEILGYGGMGVVYKAKQLRLNRVVAIKFLSSRAWMNRQFVGRFLREVHALANLQHPAIVTAYDANETDGMLYLVMEYVDGVDFAASVRDAGPVPVAQAIEWIIQAAAGLEYAHQKGMIHRDIKPSNLIVNSEGRVKILDLGLARLGEEEGQSVLTASGQVMGTVDYMSPEQANDMSRVDIRSDIYSLGCTLHYLLTGRPVYDAKTFLGKIDAHRSFRIPLLGEARDVPPELEAVFQKMVAKQPEYRQKSMSQVIQELTAVQQLTSNHYANLKNTAVLESVTSNERVHHSTKDTIPVRPPTRRSRQAVLFMLGLAAFLMAFVIYRIQTDRGTLVVKVDEQAKPQLDVLLRDKGLEVVDQKTGVHWTIGPGEQKSLDSGNWKVKQTKGLKLSVCSDAGVELDPEHFTIRRNDRIILDVSLAPIVAASHSKSPTKFEPKKPATNPPVAKVEKTKSLDERVAAIPLPDLADKQGRFTAHQQLNPGNSHAVAVGDVDGDGDIDLVIGLVKEDSEKGRIDVNAVWLNDGKGTFKDSGENLLTEGNLSAWGMALGDLDDDGDLDLYVANGYQTFEKSEVFLNNGAGKFSLHQTLPPLGSRHVALGDLDGDGDLDAFECATEGGNRVRLNDGRGTFTDSGQALGETPNFNHVVLGDVDGDGDLDAYTTGLGDYGGQDKLWINDGKAVFSDSGQKFGSLLPSEAALGDLDGDGDLDIFRGDGSGLMPYVFLNNGHGRFARTKAPIPGSGIKAVALTDLDADDDLDVLTSGFHGGLALLNDGKGNFAADHKLPALLVGTGLLIADFNGDDLQDAYVVNESGGNHDGRDVVLLRSKPSR